MPDIASVLKAEISRLARKEVRGAIGSLRRAAITYRAEIAALKRRIASLEKQLQRSRRGGSIDADPESSGDAPGQRMRFSAKGLASQRKRLGLSAHDVGQLLGVSGQSIYHWEAGQARPRARHMPAIAALRKLGRKDAAKVLASLREAR
jgi:DNA-binding transcriptional regulator YiaG